MHTSSNFMKSSCPFHENPKLSGTLKMLLAVWVLNLLLWTNAVSGHGYLGGVVIGGEYYRGFNNTSDSGVSPPPQLIAWSVNNPPMNGLYPFQYNTSDMACGIQARPARLHAMIRAGSEVQFKWAPTWYDSHVGPITTWMANCQGNCSTANPSDLRFFKIHEVGWSPRGGATWATGGTWATDTMMKNNLTWTSVLPPSIAPGKYVLRIEVIALQMAFAEGAEVYPACINVEVTGDGTQRPVGTKANNLYNPAEEGFHLFIYAPITGYKIPGPAIWPGAVRTKRI